jgi:small subunit ribosomal protein S21
MLLKSKIVVELTDGDSPERAIRRFRRLCQKFGLSSEYKKRTYHRKPSIKLKEKREKAEKRLRKEASRQRKKYKI